MAKEKRFVEIQKDGGFAEEKRVIVDTETGVQYLFIQSGYAGGLTVLVDKDGKPLLAPRTPRPE